MKLCVLPTISKTSLGGVAAVIAAHKRGLRAMGAEYTEIESKADLIIVHALAHSERRPDVFHSHGFYPTAQAGWNGWATQANNQLIQTMMTARAVVSVSELAAEVMRRDFHIQPRVIRNGVNFSEIKRGGDPRGVILWPKMDVNPTCDPAPLKWLAEKRNDLSFASLVNVGGAVRTLGRFPRRDFLALLRDCSIYLGITRENNSMGEMEAMATGIPVVGYAWGFNREKLQSGNGCELVEPGDLDGLSKSITKVLLNWREYHRAAIDYAKSNFGWDEPIREIYELYSSLI